MSKHCSTRWWPACTRAGRERASPAASFPPRWTASVSRRRAPRTCHRDVRRGLDEFGATKALVPVVVKRGLHLEDGDTRHLAEPRRGLTLTQQIFIGLALGIVVGAIVSNVDP